MARPYKYTSAEELQKLVDEYFLMCDEKKKPYTITGLALALDSSRQTLLEYEKESPPDRADYSYIIKRAKLLVENYAEELLLTEGGSGPIFALKNAGWKDRTEVFNEISYTQMGRVIATQETATKIDGDGKPVKLERKKVELSFNVGDE